MNSLLRALRALAGREGPDPTVCILCTNVGAGCPYHGGSRG